MNLKDDRWETWRVNADGTGRVKLPIPDSLLVLDASPDGAWLAARDVGDAKHWARLTLIHPDGTGTRHLTEGSARKDVFPIFRFSPDGREIAYVEVRTVDGVRTSRLFLVDIDGNASPRAAGRPPARRHRGTRCGRPTGRGWPWR